MRVQDSNSGRFIPVWQTLKGLSRQDSSRLQTVPHVTTDDCNTQDPRNICSVSGHVQNNVTTPSDQFPDYDKIVLPNGMLSIDRIDDDDKRKSIANRSSPNKTAPPLPNLLLPDMANHSNFSPHTSTSSLLATPSPCCNKSFSQSFTPSICDVGSGTATTSNEVSITIAPLNDPANSNQSDSMSQPSIIAVSQQQRTSVTALPNPDSVAPSRRASRNNSMAVLPTFPIPSVTQLNNTAALEDIGIEGPEAPNVFSGIMGALYRYTGAGSKKTRKRIVQKNGECNVTKANVAKRRRRYLQDIFTTLVDIQWRWTLVVFAMSFLGSWLGFAVLWYIICYLHGDLLPQNLPELQEETRWTPCVMNIASFTSCFLFSIETQHTIGYGSRHTTEECPHAIVVMCLQSITGVMIQAFMVGIVFAKLSRPKKRTQTLIFSRNMCILQRDGQMCLIFRVGDIRKSHIIEAHVRAQLIRKHVTEEGEEIPLFMYELDVGYDVGEDRIFFIWPMTIVHKIDEKSPLYDLSASDLKEEEFEIVVLLEGVIESTGMTTQARSSYLPDEILWGHRFEPLVQYRKHPREGFFVDLSKFNNTLPVDMPTCSARELEESRSHAESFRGGGPDSRDADDAEGNEEEDDARDGGSSHSSHGTSAGPISPHSAETIAAAPLLAVSSATATNSDHSISATDLHSTEDPPTQDAPPAQPDTVNAFLYDPEFFENLDFEGAKPLNTNLPFERHSLAFPSSDDPEKNFPLDSAPSGGGAHRRTISHPYKSGYSTLNEVTGSQLRNKDQSLPSSVI